MFFLIRDTILSFLFWSRNKYSFAGMYGTFLVTIVKIITPSFLAVELTAAVVSPKEKQKKELYLPDIDTI